MRPRRRMPRPHRPQPQWAHRHPAATQQRARRARRKALLPQQQSQCLHLSRSPSLRRVRHSPAQHHPRPQPLPARPPPLPRARRGLGRTQQAPRLGRAWAGVASHLVAGDGVLRVLAAGERAATLRMMRCVCVHVVVVFVLSLYGM